MKFNILKFSSSALKNGGYIKAAEIMIERSKKTNVLSVVSSIKGSVDLLNGALDLAVNGNFNEVESKVNDLYDIYLQEINALRTGNDENKLESLKNDLLKLLSTMSILGEITPSIRSKVMSYAESFSLEAIKITAKSMGADVNARSGGEWGIITDDEYGSARPLINSSYQAIKNKINDVVGDSKILVSGGLTGKTGDGKITYMGKGSSDMVASTFAVSLNSDILEVWSNVDGLMTADPRYIPDAKPIPRLSYKEARELLAFNSELFSPVSLDLLARHSIMLNIKNINNKDFPGSVIAQDSLISPNVAKAVAYIDNISIITLEGVNIQALIPRILNSMIDHGIEIKMMSLSTSATEFNIIVPSNLLNKCKSIIEFEFLGKDIEDYHVVNNACAISIVGEGMKGTPGVAAKLFNSVAKRSINVLMITQGSSELNIGFVVDSSSCIRALTAVHSEFM